METLTVNIVNPKAKKLLEAMEDLGLISIDNNNGSERLHDKIRNVPGVKPTLDEITEEVELVRQQQYEQGQLNNNQ